MPEKKNVNLAVLPGPSSPGSRIVYICLAIFGALIVNGLLIISLFGLNSKFQVGESFRDEAANQWAALKMQTQTKENTYADLRSNDSDEIFKERQSLFVKRYLKTELPEMTYKQDELKPAATPLELDIPELAMPEVSIEISSSDTFASMQSGLPEKTQDRSLAELSKKADVQNQKAAGTENWQMQDAKNTQGSLKPPRQHPGSRQPEYPANARRRGIAGEVVVRLLIDEHGHVIEYKWLKGHPTFKTTVEKAVKTWRYEPAMYQNKAVRVWGVKTFRFRLR